jgi:hypothetical protein
VTNEGIIVLGAPRSGTTLLRRLLDAHPRIHCPPETNLLRSCGRFLREEPMAGGLSVGVRSGLAYAGLEEQQVLDRLREFAFGICRELAIKAGKPRWAEKTAFDAFYIDEIEALCGNHCRFICLRRHGLDVAVSLHDLCEKMQMYPPELHEYVRRTAWPLEAFVRAWVDVSERLSEFAKSHADRCLDLTYEELVTRPERQLVRIGNFLQEPTDVSAWLAAAAGPTSPGLGDWKTFQTQDITDRSVGRWQALPADVLTRLAAIANPVLVTLGYPPVDAGQPADGVAARRALQLSLLAARLRDTDKPAGS